MSRQVQVRERQRGDASVYALAVGCLLVLLVLFLGLADFMGVMGVREQAQTALVTSTRAAARQINVASWVLQHQLQLDPPRANQAFQSVLDANLAESALISGQAQRQFTVGTGPGGKPVVTGEIWVPVKTGNLGISLTFHLKYRTFISVAS